METLKPTAATMGRPPTPLGTWGKITRHQLPNGMHQARARYRDYDGKTRGVKANGATAASAERALLQNLRDRAQTHDTDAAITPDTTIATLSSAWISHREDENNLSLQTLGTYRDVIANTILPALSDVRIRETTTGLLDRHLTAITSSTRRKWARIILTGMFKLAAQHDAVDRNPVRETSAPRSVAKETRALTLDEVRQLRTNIDTWQHDQEHGRPRGIDLVQIVDVMLGTGLRIGEVLALSWTDTRLDEEPPTITVNGTVVLVDGKFVLQSRPKTRSGRRTIALPRFVVASLEKQRARGWEQISPLVFPSATGTVRSPHNVRRNLRAARGTELDWVTPHTLRKTAATFVDATFGTGAASQLLGHSGTAVTEKHYIHRAALAPDVSSALDQLANQNVP